MLTSRCAICQLVLLLFPVSWTAFLAAAWTVLSSYDLAHVHVRTAAVHLCPCTVYQWGANCLTPPPSPPHAALQVELIADELKGWADRDILQQLQEVVGQVLEPEQQKVVTGMFGL